MVTIERAMDWAVAHPQAHRESQPTDDEVMTAGLRLLTAIS